MERRVNCWEFKQCGNNPGEPEKAACPVIKASQANGVNRGTNGGRFCWAVAGTFCSGEVQGTFARKLGNCLNCDFFRMVEREEERYFALLPPELAPGIGD
jgi:hypothetical protein